MLIGAGIFSSVCRMGLWHGSVVTWLSYLCTSSLPYSPQQGRGLQPVDYSQSALHCAALSVTLVNTPSLNTHIQPVLEWLSFCFVSRSWTTGLLSQIAACHLIVKRIFTCTIKFSGKPPAGLKVDIHSCNLLLFWKSVLASLNLNIVKKC